MGHSFYGSILPHCLTHPCLDLPTPDHQADPPPPAKALSLIHPPLPLACCWLLLLAAAAAAADDEESDKCHLGAVIVRDVSIVVSNYRSVMTLDEYCKKHNVLGISGLDTRALTKV